MSMNDPIAEFLTHLRNASRARKSYCDVSWSKMRQSLVEILKEAGFVRHFLVRKEGSRGTIRVFLKYRENRMPLIQQLKRVSKVGCRKYVKASEIQPVLRGLGLSIISTSKGVMSGEQARKEKVGGEFICQVW